MYRPTGSVYHSVPGSLEAWLTNRYCLYTSGRHGRIYRAEIDHDPWPLQAAEAKLRFDALTTQHGIQLPHTAPLLQFARRLEVRFWLLQPLS